MRGGREVRKMDEYAGRWNEWIGGWVGDWWVGGQAGGQISG